MGGYDGIKILGDRVGASKCVEQNDPWPGNHRITV